MCERCTKGSVNEPSTSSPDHVCQPSQSKQFWYLLLQHVNFTSLPFKVTQEILTVQKAFSCDVSEVCVEPHHCATELISVVQLLAEPCWFICRHTRTLWRWVTPPPCSIPLFLPTALSHFFHLQSGPYWKPVSFGYGNNQTLVPVSPLLVSVLSMTTKLSSCAF